MTTHTTVPTSSLTERYVTATLRSVPADRRDDLGEELRSTIRDMVEARLDNGEDPAAAEYAALAELGDPGRLAASYTDQRLELIGPRYFLIWKNLTVQLLTWVPAVIATLVAVVAVLDGGNSVGEVITSALGAAATSAIQIAFWTTLVFAILDRFALDTPQEWTPDMLPEAPAAREYPLSEAVGSIAINLVIAAVLVLQNFRSWVPGPDGDDVAVLNPDLWSGWLPFLLVVTVAVIGIEVWKYARGWSIGAVAATVVTSVAYSGVVAWLANDDRLLNPGFVEVVGLEAGTLESLNLAIAVGAVLVGVWEIGEAVVKGVLHQRRPA